MILTQCAVCATELGLSLGKKCGRCSTRYCGPECQKQHWQEGGHDKLCKKIKKTGGAEQYNANTKYSEAVAAAVEECADDTKGQTCYICTQPLHWKTKEGLVRGCSCRGTSGFAHVSCLAEQAKILVAEAEENNLGLKAKNERWRQWYSCSLCEQKYHGVVRCALGWVCWKTYVGRGEGDALWRMAMNLLGLGLYEASRFEEAVAVRETEFSMERRLNRSEKSILVVQGNLAGTYHMLGRLEQASSMYRDVYAGMVRLYGEEQDETLRAAYNYALSLNALLHFKEAKSLLRKMTPVAQRVLGENIETTLRMKWTYAQSLYKDPDATLDDVREAVETLEDADRIARRVLGGAHPITARMEGTLQKARANLRARKASPVNS